MRNTEQLCSWSSRESKRLENRTRWVCSPWEPVTESEVIRSDGWRPDSFSSCSWETALTSFTPCRFTDTNQKVSHRIHNRYMQLAPPGVKSSSREITALPQFDVDRTQRGSCPAERKHYVSDRWRAALLSRLCVTWAWQGVMKPRMQPSALLPALPAVLSSPKRMPWMVFWNSVFPSRKLERLGFFLNVRQEGITLKYFANVSIPFTHYRRPPIAGERLTEMNHAWNISARHTK